MLTMPQYSETISKGRSRAYHLLAALYHKEAGKDLLEILWSKEVARLFEDLGVDIGRLVPDSPDKQKAFLEKLAEEYAALFVLPGGVSPYESVRLKGLLCQDPEWNVRGFYSRCGLVLRDGSRIFADHIGFELSFMGYLSGNESQALYANNEEEALKWRKLQQEFFSSHLGKWVFGFLDDLDRLALHPFYKEVSRLTRKFMEMEQEDIVGKKSAGRK